MRAVMLSVATLVAAAGCRQEITEVVEVPASAGQGGEATYHGPDPANDCEVGCDNLRGCADLPACVAQCKAVDRKACGFERGIFEACLAREVRPGSCYTGLGCGDAVSQWLSCLGIGFDGQCTPGAQGACACEMVDTLGHEFAMDCFEPDGGGTSTCVCYRDGAALGTCVDDNPCEATRGCCTTLFFAGGTDW